MIFPWATVRAISARVFVRADRAVRSASVGPPGSVPGLSDLENQAINDLDQEPVKEKVEEKITIFTVLKIVTVLSAFYLGANPWFETKDHYHRERFMCPRLVVCAPTLVEMILLTGSRFTAGIIHPGLVISIFSKCYATRSFLHHSWLGSVIDLEPSHDIHTYFGFLTFLAALVHSILHAARYIYANQTYIMYETDAGRSGLIACALLLPIVLPMRFEFMRTRLSYQLRKSLHMLFLPMSIALCFHSVVFRYVGCIIVVWYTLDRIYFTTKQSFLIDHPVFEAVGRGTMVTLDLPTGYTFKAGSYVYVNSPMISTSEWHPFSIIQVPGDPPRATFYAEAVGDWTKDLFRLGIEQDRLPLWITAAQPSLMEKSIYYDNIVLVCTGAGITPAVSIIERFAKKKNLHLLWMSRDGGMVALFEKQLRKVNSTVHLTGSPDDDTKVALQSLLEPVAITGIDQSRRTSGLKPTLSFRNILTMDSSKNRQPRTRTRTRNDNDDGEANDNDANGVSDGGNTLVVPPALPPRPNLTLSNIIQRTTDTSQRNGRRPTKRKDKMSDPVNLEFGRPDINSYLIETFASKPGRSGSKTKRDRQPADMSIDMSRSARVPRQPECLSELERSRRLNTDQKLYKETLMRADATVLEDDEYQPQETEGTNSTGATTETSSMSTITDRPLRWLVLYCGANLKVEEAIARTCDDLNVNWQKEYFGAW